MVVPLSAMLRFLLETRAVDRAHLKRSLEKELNLDNFPPQLTEMLRPIWGPLIKICENLDDHEVPRDPSEGSSEPGKIIPWSGSELEKRHVLA